MTNLDEDFVPQTSTAALRHYEMYREELEKFDLRKRRLAPEVVGIPSGCKCRADGDVSRCALHGVTEPVVSYEARDIIDAKGPQVEVTIFGRPYVISEDPVIEEPTAVFAPLEKSYRSRRDKK